MTATRPVPASNAPLAGLLTTTPRGGAGGGRRHLARRHLEDLVGPAQFAVLALQNLDPFLFRGRQAAAGTAVDLGLADPLADGLRADAQLAGDVGDRAVANPSFGGRIGHQSDRDVRRVALRC